MKNKINNRKPQITNFGLSNFQLSVNTNMNIPGVTLEATPRTRFQWLKQSLAVAATLVALLVAPAPAYSASGEGESAAPVEMPENLTRKPDDSWRGRRVDHAETEE